MASFDVFLPLVLQSEGGYSNDPDDPGGETNKGITMRLFQQCSHELLGIDPTSENLRGLTDAQAGIIYKAAFWDKISGDAFELQDLANIVCDSFVNSGTHATTLLQKVLNNLGANVIVDGVIGRATVQALSSLDQTAVYRQYKQGRIDYYRNLGVSYPMYLKGWLNRVNSFPDL
jgi:lysozyme family protein